jgi:hypothetical protein
MKPSSILLVIAVAVLVMLFVAYPAKSETLSPQEMASYFIAASKGGCHIDDYREKARQSVFDTARAVGAPPVLIARTAAQIANRRLLEMMSDGKLHEFCDDMRSKLGEPV